MKTALRNSPSARNLTRIMIAIAGLFFCAAAFAASGAARTRTEEIPPFPGTLVNARYVYVTSYDGDLFDPNLMTEDRDAITAVQDAIQKSGKFTVVYKPEQADMILMVTGRPSEDILAVYNAHGWRRDGQYLWRMTGRNGLQAGETPLVTNLEKAFAKAAQH